MRSFWPVFPAPFPLAVALAWVWALAVVLLLLLGLSWLWAPRALQSLFAWRDYCLVWLGSPVPARLCWSATLIVAWLWVGHRTQVVQGRPGGPATTVGLLAAAVVMLVIAWVVLRRTAVSSLPRWQLTRIYP